ncbi:TadE/TadG family type IV pilus assembly protein [Vannielia litorea]|uniref:TadE/TadG family type IV pilus assembly protein n=1 Tax=Vannielia litorea TaxID=1217970 RepID=UPI001C96243D|nr:TadE/TadG family type IV pilus assembly protein [Vannielia litorea]MBY6047772.1 VWA domain-containing protein [Vannielia litorea]MBY6075186.1 VWA domain-containing protein [Vannielia litorea]
MKTKQNTSHFARFTREEDGGLIIFSLFLFVCMMLAVGLAIDVMRTEMARTRLQNTVDNAVLAAAAMEQDLDPAFVVNDYFERAGLSSNLEGVTVNAGVNYKTVTAHTNTKLPMYFLGMVGIDKMEAKSEGTATAGYTDVEISLVLDITGSMGRNNKLPNLKVAASDFVDTVLDPTQPGSVSLSLVPYSAQVNIGPEMIGQLNVPLSHSHSHCVDFEAADFTSAAVSLTAPYAHMQHFQYYSSATTPIDNPGCVQEEFERVTPFSQNRTALKAQINQFEARANTAIHLGMKWGVALLDPSMQPVISNLAASGHTDPTFAGRPYAYSRENTQKIVVLMTDGENVNTTRLKPQYYDSASEIERWHQYSVSAYAYSVGQNWQNYVTTKYTSSQADTMLGNICDAAKSAGITVFTIGFEVTTHSGNVMRNCASTPAHYFDVEGTEISDAFDSIARQISTLRLTN